MSNYTETILPDIKKIRSEERRVGKSVDLGGRRIIKKTFFQAEDGIRDMSPGDWSSDVCSSDLLPLSRNQDYGRTDSASDIPDRKSVV